MAYDYAMNTLTQMEAAVADAATVANELEQINRRLARLEQIDAQSAEAVDLLALQVAAAGTRWQMIDPEAAALAWTAAIEAQHAALRRDEADARATLRLALGKLLYALTALAEGESVAADRDPKEVARWLLRNAEVSQSEVARLLGTPVRTLQRWVSDAPTAPSGVDAARLRLLAQLIVQLRHIFSPAGTVRWLRSPNGHLDGRSPVDVLGEEPDQAAMLVELARSSRFQVAS
jgi:uncharacterized protein (DUF2384 family)